jgi:hypothetical protein
MAKLDRILGSVEWDNKYPLASVSDEDINTLATIIPSVEILGPIT